MVPTLAGISMSCALWLPFVVGLSLLAIGALATTLLPTPERHDRDHSPENESLLSGHADEDADGKQAFTKTDMLRSTKIKFRALWSQISGRRNFQLLLGVFFAASFASANSALLPQYISKRYNWTFAHSGYLLSIKALVNITLLAVIVPFIVHLLGTRFGYESGHISKMGAQLMFSISVIGVLLVALAPNVPYLIFGNPESNLLIYISKLIHASILCLRTRFRDPSVHAFACGASICSRPKLYVQCHGLQRDHDRQVCG